MTLVEHIKLGLLETLSRCGSARFNDPPTDSTFRAAAELIVEGLIYDTDCDCGNHLQLVITRAGLNAVRRRDV